MERRPLSPHTGAWDAAGDVSVRGSLPGSPEKTTITQRVLIVMQSHGSPQQATEPGCGASDPAEPGLGAYLSAEHNYGASHLEYTSTNLGVSLRTSKLEQETSSSESIPITFVSQPTPSTPGQDRSAAPRPSAPGQDRSAAPRPSAPGQDRGTAPPPSAPGQDQSAAPRPSAPGQDRSAAKRPSAPGQDRSAAPRPSAPGQDRSAAPRPSAPGQDRSTAPSPSAPGQDRSTAPPPSAPGQDRSTAPPPSAPVRDQGEKTQDTLITNARKSIQAPINGTPEEKHRVQPSHAMIQDWASSPPIQNQLTALQHSATQDTESGGKSPLPDDMLRHGLMEMPNFTGAQDCATSHEEGTPLQADMRAKGDIADGASQSTTLSHLQNITSSIQTFYPEDIKSCTTRPEDTRVAPSARPAGPEDTRVAPSAGPEDTRVAPSAGPEDTRVAPSAGPEDTRVAPSAGPEDTRVAPSAGPEDTRVAPSAGPEDTRVAPSAGPEDTRVAPSAGPEDTRVAPSAGPEDTRVAPSAGPEDTRVAPSAGPEDTRVAPSAGPEDTRVAPSAGPEDTRVAPSAGPEDTRVAPSAGPEDTRVAPSAGPEDTRVAPSTGPEVTQSITIISPISNKQAQQRQDGGAAMGNLNSTSQSQMSSLPAQPSLGRPSLSPIRVLDPSSPHRNMSSKPPLPIPSRSNLYPGHPPREQDTSASHETVSLASFKSKTPASDTLSYLDSVSLMSGTMESLTLLDDASSLGSDSEINGMPYRKTDKYGFLGGNQFSGNSETAIPVEIARQRELKWLDMFSNWDKWLTRRFQKVKLRCRKGIPSSLRAKAWQYLSNSHELLIRNPGKFEEMERQQGDPKWLDVIEKDLHRQFPFHEMFAARGGHGQQDLYRILKAYTVYRPEEGYCQAQAPVAAVLLMHMPAEQAFWCLVQICDKYLPGYYSAGLEAIQLDGEIFFALLRRVCPMAYRHLKKFKIDPILYMTEWFMCIFSRTLPWVSVLRVWDMFFCEGVKIIFRVGLVLLRHTLGSVDKLRSCQGMYETMEKLRSLPVYCMQEEVLLPEVSSLPVTDSLIERESNTQLRKWRENRGELQYRPSRRLHGTRQIHEEKLRLNPTLSGSRLSLSSIRRPSPPATPAVAAQPESLVVSEGLRPALPSPTSNQAPLGPPKEATKKGKEKQEKKREKEEREQEKKREKEEREERKKEKEREKQKEKEEKRVQKEREKAESRQKKERKFSFRRKESSAADSPRNSGSGATDGSAAHDTYF
ncbi:TBC1 domain family member 10B [Ranitomeya imitator]|uniref:TBC1 domain family member 10B n=1 Tax=Ranitomeya imitator TaxID=111125 RepID=UPI0037E7A294